MNRLKDQRAFNRVFQKGKQKKAAGISIRYFKRKDCGKNRVGVAVSRTVPNAVIRNYAKRIMRELYYTFESRTKSGYDIVLLCLRPQKKMNFARMKETYETLLKDADIFIS